MGGFIDRCKPLAHITDEDLELMWLIASEEIGESGN
jgi:hypothetical protein